MRENRIRLYRILSLELIKNNNNYEFVIKLYEIRKQIK